MPFDFDMNSFQPVEDGGGSTPSTVKDIFTVTGEYGSKMTLQATKEGLYSDGSPRNPASFQVAFNSLDELRIEEPLKSLIKKKSPNKLELSDRGVTFREIVPIPTADGSESNECYYRHFATSIMACTGEKERMWVEINADTDKPELLRVLEGGYTISVEGIEITSQDGNNYFSIKFSDQEGDIEFDGMNNINIPTPDGTNERAAVNVEYLNARIAELEARLTALENR